MPFSIFWHHHISSWASNIRPQGPNYLWDSDDNGETSDGGGDACDDDDDNDSDDDDDDDDADFWKKPPAEQAINYTGSSQNLYSDGKGCMYKYKYNTEKKLYLQTQIQDLSNLCTASVESVDWQRKAISFTNFHRILNRLVPHHNTPTLIKVIITSIQIIIDVDCRPAQV